MEPLLDMETLIKETNSSMENIVIAYQKEIDKIRTGRVNPNILENIKVECYGDIDYLRAIATIKVVEAKQLLILPYDLNLLKNCTEALKKVNLNAQIKVEQEGIRLIFPDLTGETRNMLVRDLKKITEQFRVHIRNARRDTLHKMKSLELSEDVNKQKMAAIQTITNEKIALIDKIEKVKIDDLLHI